LNYEPYCRPWTLAHLEPKHDSRCKAKIVLQGVKEAGAQIIGLTMMTSETRVLLCFCTFSGLVRYCAVFYSVATRVEGLVARTRVRQDDSTLTMIFTVCAGLPQRRCD
jgi:hypothetical protein